jgi:hypothetical protein
MDGITAAVEIYNRLGIRSIVLTEHCDWMVQMRAAEATLVAVLTRPRQCRSSRMRFGPHLRLH